MERKEAIEIIRSNFHNGSVKLSEALKTLIPELEENENDDDGIRMDLIEFVRQYGDNYYGQFSKASVISWLEKQGEQNKQHLYDIIISLWGLLDKIDTFVDLQINDTSQHNPFRKIEDITQERHKFVKSDGYNLFIDDFMITNDKNFEKQGEKKSADNVGPKFKAGDWIICDGLHPALILNVADNKYEIEFTDNGAVGHHAIDFIERHWHLWTIEDTKDGDVLVSGSGCPFIYKNINDRLALFYCCVSADNDFLIGNDRSYCGLKKTAKPATKKQHDYLFQRMNDAEYKWDANKKELHAI